MDTVLAVVAHADDEILGCGGALFKHSSQGDKVFVLVMADGVSSRNNASQKEKEKRIHLAQRVQQLMEIESYFFCDLPDNQLDTVSRLTINQTIEVKLAEIQPSIVYTHHWGDLNIDHRLVHEATTVACRPFLNQTTKSLRFFEVSSSTDWQVPRTSSDFAPNLFIDISQTLKKKLQALRIYENEMRSWPHARSYQAVEALARWRGASVGLAAAEAFVIGREIK